MKAAFITGTRESAQDKMQTVGAWEQGETQQATENLQLTTQDFSPSDTLFDPPPDGVRN